MLFSGKVTLTRLKLILLITLLHQLKMGGKKLYWAVILNKEVTGGDTCAGRWSCKNTDFAAYSKNEGLRIKAKKLSVANTSQDSILF